MTSKKIAQLKCIRFAAVPAAILCAFSAHAEPFDTGSWKGALDTQITVGAGFRLRDPAGYLIGDPTVNSGAATGVWSFGDNGDLNYKKNHAFSGYVKLTSELLAHNEPTGLDIMARGTAFYDPVAADTYRTELSGDAAAQVVHNTQLLDLWVGHKFSVDDKQWRVRVGNQVINWGESVFLFGGINASSAIDFQKSLIPGTQIKEYVLPAPLISVAGQLGDGWNAEGYYQMFWNQNKYPAIGSYWSTSDFFGRGVSDAVTFWTANPNLAGLDAAAFARLNSVSGNFCNSAGTNCITSLGGATGRGGAAATGRISSVTLAQINSDILNGYYANYPTNATNPAIGAVWGAGTLPTINPGNSGQFGLALHRKAEGSTVDYGLYYLHYTDKSPVFSIVGDSTVSAGVDYQASYLKNRDLFGVSTNFPLGPWAIGAELSYRPRDAVGLSGCYNAGSTVLSAANAAVVANCPLYKDMQKYETHLTATLTLTPSDNPTVMDFLKADSATLTAEGVLTYYPGVKPLMSQTLSGGTVVTQAVAAGGLAWTDSQGNLVGVGTPKSAGAIVDFNWTYDGTIFAGWQITAGATYFNAFHGYTPNPAGSYLQGAQSINYYLLINQNPTIWQAGFNLTRFFGGDIAGAQPYKDRDMVGAFVTYNF